MVKNDNLQNNLKLINDSSQKIRETLNALLDDGSFVETDVFTCGASFIDGVSANGEGVVTGYAAVGGVPVHLFAHNAAVMKGSLSAAHSKKIVKAMERAIKSGMPFVSVIDSSGARIGEGTAMLEGYSALLKGAADMANSIPHICIVKGACVGMMTAFAALADFVIMSDKAFMSVAPPMALAAGQNDYPKLDKILGAKVYMENGDLVNFTYSGDADLKDKLNQLITIITAEGQNSTDDANRETALAEGEPVRNIIGAVCDDARYMEYSPLYAKDAVCALATINNLSVGILATDRTVNDGYISLGGLKKAAAFVRVLDGLDIPLISLVDCKGVRADLKDEKNSLAIALAELAGAIASSENARIGVVVGDAIGAAYSVLAGKGIGFDYTLATQKANITPIASETAVNVLYADELKKAKNTDATREKLQKLYKESEGNPFISAKDGYIDNVVATSTLRPYIASALMMLLGL